MLDDNDLWLDDSLTFSSISTVMHIIMHINYIIKHSQPLVQTSIRRFGSEVKKKRLKMGMLAMDTALRTDRNRRNKQKKKYHIFNNPGIQHSDCKPSNGSTGCPAPVGSNWSNILNFSLGLERPLSICGFLFKFKFAEWSNSETSEL